jgi:hypothetical protein
MVAVISIPTIQREQKENIGDPLSSRVSLSVVGWRRGAIYTKNPSICRGLVRQSN